MREIKTIEQYRERMIEAFHNAGYDELIAYVVLPFEEEFITLEKILKCWKRHSFYPSAESVRHGKWMWVDGVRCSQCNYKLATTGLPSYCPNCGARMDGERKEE